MQRWKGRGHSLRLVLALAVILTLGSFAPAAYAEEMLSSLDGRVDALVPASDQTDPTPEPTPDPTPEPTPDPTPEPTPDPTPEPTPDLTPEPTPDPTPEPTPDPTPEPTPDSTPEAPAATTGDPGATTSTGLFGPGATSVRESIIGESAQNDSGIVLENEENVQGGAGSLVRAAETSMLQELASTGDSAITAAEGTSLCPGLECGSTFDAKRWGALALVLICVLLAVAGTFTIRAGRRQSNTDPPAEEASGMMIRTSIANPTIPPRRKGPTQQSGVRF